MKDKTKGKFRDNLYKIEEVLSVTGLVAVVFSTLLGVVVVANKALNHQVVDKPSYHLILRPFGVAGHTEYIRYSDGSTEIEKAPFLGRIGVTKTYQELNRDKFIDRIKKERGEILVREYDYQAHKKEFDEADRILRELSSRESY